MTSATARCSRCPPTSSSPERPQRLGPEQVRNSHPLAHALQHPFARMPLRAISYVVIRTGGSRVISIWRRQMPQTALHAILSIAILAAPSSIPTSSAVAKFIEQVSGGAREAEALFWKQLEPAGTPIVERIDGTDESLVTFVYRGNSSVANVVVVTPAALVDFSDAVMTKVPKTQTWFKTLRLRNDTRFTYRFAPNDSLIPFDRPDRNFMTRMKSWVRDPLNQKEFRFEDGAEASVLELPAAPSDALLIQRNDVAQGLLTAVKLPFPEPNGRPAWIYTPPRFTRGGRYPLVVFMDGESYTTLIPTPTILNNLIARGAIPPVIAVFLASDGSTRDTEYNCSRDWSDLLALHLVPWVRAEYGAGSEQTKTTVAGYSLGGLAAACAALHHPEVFGNVLVQSGSFYRAPEGEPPEGVARKLASSPAVPVRWYLEIGLFEHGAFPSRDPSMLTSSRHLRDVLLAKGAAVSFYEGANGHEHFAWRATLPTGLTLLLGAPGT
jgi:enterochelin esterase-like enzyme